MLSEIRLEPCLFILIDFFIVGAICEHKAIEARAKGELDLAMGMLGQAKYAYGLAGEEGLKKMDDLAKVAISIREKATKDKLPLLSSSPRLPGIGGYLPERFQATTRV